MPPVAEPMIANSQVTVSRPADDVIQTASGPMKWRRWLVLERERLLGAWMWADLWIKDSDDGTATLYGILTERAIELMSKPGGGQR